MTLMLSLLVLLLSSTTSVLAQQPKVPTETYPIKIVSLTVDNKGVAGEIWIYQKPNMVFASSYYVYAKIISKTYVEAESQEAVLKGPVSGFPNVVAVTFAFKSYDPANFRACVGRAAEYIPDHNQQTDNILGEFRDQGPNYDLVSFANAAVPSTTTQNSNNNNNQNTGGNPAPTSTNGSGNNNGGDNNGSGSGGGGGGGGGSNLIVILAVVCTIVVLLILGTLGFACYRRRLAERNEILVTLPWKKRGSLADSSRGGVMGRTERSISPSTTSASVMQRSVSPSSVVAHTPTSTPVAHALPPVGAGATAKMIVEPPVLPAPAGVKSLELPPVKNVSPGSQQDFGTLKTDRTNFSEATMVEEVLAASAVSAKREDAVAPPLAVTASKESKGSSSSKNADEKEKKSKSSSSKPKQPTTTTTSTTPSPVPNSPPQPAAAYYPAPPPASTTQPYAYDPAYTQQQQQQQPYDPAAAAAYQQQWYAAAAAAQQQQAQQQQWLYAQQGAQYEAWVQQQQAAAAAAAAGGYYGQGQQGYQVNPMNYQGR
ncbi:hypothetical protein HDU97_005821 [Phlyctochytrium planicorne]|nr:hypothetical protein HDU97_005821 [Phlyctochytrium planicorne]